MGSNGCKDYKAQYNWTDFVILKQCCYQQHVAEIVLFESFGGIRSGSE